MFLPRLWWYKINIYYSITRAASVIDNTSPWGLGSSLLAATRIASIFIHDHLYLSFRRLLQSILLWCLHCYWLLPNDLNINCSVHILAPHLFEFVFNVLCRLLSFGKGGLKQYLALLL